MMMYPAKVGILNQKKPSDFGLNGCGHQPSTASQIHDANDSVEAGDAATIDNQLVICPKDAL